MTNRTTLAENLQKVLWPEIMSPHLAKVKSNSLLKKVLQRLKNPLRIHLPLIAIVV
ncbi:MAG TPA: hypothetical protein VE692_04895 [Nitrososphaera sp.]|nr:hypothetical protein [Nitrososphaera sp.]